MPSASKYIIDVANIKPGGNSIKELWVGNSESKYAMHGNTCIYDKVLYELSVNDISNVEPNAQTVTFTYTSKKTHGNGGVDTLGINPTTSAITANHSTASTKTTTCTVKQSLTNNGTLTGNSVNVTVTQIKNYPTALTLTISPKSTIPAAGGSISSALTNYNYTVTATYKSGSSSAVTSDANTTITANVTGITAASKGTTASTVTTAGTIRFTAKYVCNGKTVTTTADVNITQDKNEVVSYANPTFTLTPSSNQTLPASGGSVTAAVSNVRQVRTWSSTSTDTITPTSTTSWTAQTISCNSRGTTTGGTLTLGTTTATVTANGKSTSKSYVVYQEANAITAYSKPTGLSLSCADIPAGGGTVTAATGGTVSQTRTYTSKATDTINPTVTITWNPAQTATASSLGTTVKARTKITTLTATYSANGQSNSTSVDVYQQANAQGTTPLWGDISLTAVTLSCSDVPASGGTVTPSWSGTAKQNRRYQYTSGSYTNWELVNITPTVTWNPTSKTATSLGTTDKAKTSLGDCTATFTGNSSKTATKAITVYQEANTHTDSWSNPVVTITYANPFSAAGETKTPTTCTATQSGTRTWTSKASASITNTDFTWGNYSMTNGSGFTLANASTGAVTAASRGTTEGAARSNNTIRRTATGAGSKQGTGSATVSQQANAVVSTTWNNPVVTLNPASLSFTSGASSQNITASATQSGVATYTSTSTASTSNSSFTWSWTKDGSWITVGTSGTATKSITVTANSGNERSGSVTATATGSGSKTGSKSASVAQARKESEEEGPFYGQLDISQVTLSCSDVPAGGGTVYPSWAGTVYQYYYYTKDGVVTRDGWVTITPTVYWTPTSITGSNLGTTTKDRTSLGNCTATFVGYDSQSDTKSITVYQQANTKTERTTYSDLRDTSYFRNSAPNWSGETVTFTSAGTVHIGNFYLLSIILVVDAKMKRTTTISYTSGAGSSTTAETGCLGYATCSENWLLQERTNTPINVGPLAGDVPIKANANPNTTQRTATIHTSFTWEGMTATKDLVVTQEASPVTPTTESYSIQVQGGVFSNQNSELTVWTEYNSTNLSLEGSFACGTLWDECSPATAEVILIVEGEHNFTVSEVPINGTKQITWTVDWSFWKTNGYSGGPTTGSLLNLALYADNSKKQDVTVSYPTTTRTMDIKYSDLHGASNITLVINAAQQNY